MNFEKEDQQNWNAFELAATTTTATTTTMIRRCLHNVMQHQRNPSRRAIGCCQ
jgi:hypothetical protein